ncbi:MAG: arylsulfatase [Candidatus Cryptobacteroides sp.]
MEPLSIASKTGAVILAGASACIATGAEAKGPVSGQRPNVIVILADDLGYGDISCMNPDSKIPTPNIDALCNDGVRFTNAHAASTLSTPSRYGLMTGRYPWRTRLKQGAFNGYALPLIENDVRTMAHLFSESGYSTACIGKWHLGMGWQYGTEDPSYKKSVMNGRSSGVDYKAGITDGPTDHGFDYFFGLAGSLDMAPYAFVENKNMFTLPDHTIPKGQGLLLMHGGDAGEGFEPKDCLPEIFRRGTEYVNAAKDSEKPFFLYLPITAPHTPVLPHDEYIGKSGIGPYGDFVVMIDDLVGKLTAQLEKNGQLENTIIVFTSDNGCAPYVNIKDIEKKGHFPSYIYKGYKTDIYEGGHRMPLLISWKNHFDSAVRDCPVCLTDLYSTFAEMLGASLGDRDGVDSYSIWKILEGKAGKNSRTDIIYESGNGFLSIYRGRYKLIFHPGSGGWGYPSKSEDLKGLPEFQFFDLKNDPHEDNNLYPRMKDKAIIRKMTETIRGQILSGRSNAGVAVSNDTPANWNQIQAIVK